eukprot:5453338-Pleurochrysis_carterae.AAC.2
MCACAGDLTLRLHVCLCACALRRRALVHNLYSDLQARLRFFVMQSLAFLRISELFDIIVDYPDSVKTEFLRRFSPSSKCPETHFKLL